MFIQALGDLPDGLRIAMGEFDDNASAQELPTQVIARLAQGRLDHSLLQHFNCT